MSGASPIREFALKAVLWLPLAFVVWFRLAGFWVWPPTLMAREVVLRLPESPVTAIALGGERIDAEGRVIGRAEHLVTLSTNVQVVVPASANGPGGVGVLEPTINPMVYGYALPLFLGLVMATPLTVRRRLLQGAVAIAAIWCAQAFGIVAEALKVLGFESGPEGIAAIARTGIPLDGIAVAYQFALLILPAVLPVLLWVGFNRPFIQSLVQGEAAGGEPLPVSGGPTSIEAESSRLG